jgi:hypothetical protein
MTTECIVCDEKYNKTRRRAVKCKCDFECCRECAKKYISLKIDEEASCMSCKVVWDKYFMYDNFEKTYMNKEYKNHEAELLFNKETALFKQTQPYVEYDIKKEELYKEIEAKRKEYINKTVLNDYTESYPEFHTDDLKALLANKTRREIIYIEEKIDNLTIDIKDLDKKCPQENCEGFMNSLLECDLCGCKTCYTCHEIKTVEPHVCDEEVLKNMEAIQKETKPCPVCDVPTYKINGCDSMWCVKCKTSWNWITRKIETGVNHNPEFFAYQHKVNGIVERNPLDIRCGREIDKQFIDNLRNLTVSRKDITQKLMDICINIYMTQSDMRNLIRFVYTDNLELRVRYMRNKIDKETFKTWLINSKRSRERNAEIINIVSIYVNCATELFYLLETHKGKEILANLEGLKDHINECLKESKKYYTGKGYEINDWFILHL